MNRYQKVKVNISLNLIKSRRRFKTEVLQTVNLKLSYQDLNREHVLALTKTQMNKIVKAYTNGTGVVLNLSKKQIEHNSKVEGGFIGALLPLLGLLGSTLATRVVPALATGLLAGVGSSAGSAMVDKIAGRGIVYAKKDGRGMKMTAAGSGMFLRPWIKGDSVGGDGLYIRSGRGYESVGSGLLLGPNSPYSSIHFLNLIL